MPRIHPDSLARGFAYGALVVEDPDAHTEDGDAAVRVRCVCGMRRLVLRSHFLLGYHASCGQRENHGGGLPRHPGRAVPGRASKKGAPLGEESRRLLSAHLAARTQSAMAEAVGVSGPILACAAAGHPVTERTRSLVERALRSLPAPGKPLSAVEKIRRGARASRERSATQIGKGVLHLLQPWERDELAALGARRAELAPEVFAALVEGRAAKPVDVIEARRALVRVRAAETRRGT